MPPPPLIASTHGQRAAVSAAMAVLLACSLAAAYAVSQYAPAPRGQRSAGRAGSIQLMLGDQWQAQDAEDWTRRLDLPHASVFTDTQRPSRQLVVGTLTNDQPIDPQALSLQLLQRATEGQVQVLAPYTGYNTEAHLVYFELCAHRQEQQGLAQHLVAVVAKSDDGRDAAVLYLRDVVEDKAMYRYNLVLFRRIYQSIQLP